MSPPVHKGADKTTSKTPTIVADRGSHPMYLRREIKGQETENTKFNE